MLIIEGADMLGKTTLCKALVDDLNASDAPYRPYVYRHFTRLPPQWDYYWDYLPHIDVGVVMDRFHLSAQAYGRAVDGREHIDKLHMRLLRAQLDLKGAYVVLLLATRHLINMRYEQLASREMFDVESIAAANEAFSDLRWMANEVIWCTPQYPWVSDEARRHIARSYADHLREFASVMARRPTRL